MALKFLKPAAALAVGSVLIGFFLFGGDFLSYLRTSTRAVQTAAKDMVSVEFELQRARDLVQEMLPRLQANVRMIAEDEVEIANLEKDIAASRDSLDRDRERLGNLRGKLSVQQVSYRIADRDVSREHLTEQLSAALSRYQEAELTLSSKEELLETRRKSLAAAMQMLDRAKAQKLQLEQKIESLVAQHRVIKASSTGRHSDHETADFSRAEKLVADIETRLDVAQRIVAHENELVPIDLTAESASTDEVLAEFDAYFDDDTRPEESLAASEL